MVETRSGLTPEAEGPSQINLDSLFGDIEKFNSQENISSRMAEVIFMSLKNPPVPKEKIRLIDLEINHQHVLNEVGIGLEEIKKKEFYTEGSDGITGEIFININEPKKFIAFLKSIDAERIQPNQEQWLKNFAAHLTKQLKHQYDLNNPGDERLLNLFSALSEMVEQYRRLDNGQNHLANEIAELEKLLEIARKGYLREYINVIESPGSLLAEVGGKNFGPSQWQIDCSPEKYKSYWKNAFAILRETRKNEKATEFYRQLVNHFTQSLEYALKFLDENPSYYSPDHQTEILETALKFREEIKDY